MRALAWVLVAACATDPGPPGPRPADPAGDAAGVDIDGVRAWSLIGNAGTPGHDALALDVQAPAGVDVVDVWLDDQAGVRLTRQGSRFRAELPLTALAPGEHSVVFAEAGASTGFAVRRFQRSHPYYVVMTTDWDFADPSQPALVAQDAIRFEHPDLKITHFVGPYTFTDPAVTPTRRQALVDWLLAQANGYGDEIGLHIHPYCSFVEYAGLACVTDESTVYVSDPSGYTVLVAAYDEAEFGQLLVAADDLFGAAGLPLPRTFRAGGWTASVATLRALDAHGYVADTSALNWARMEEWMDQGTGVLYDWNMAAWSTIGDTSQPYRPNVDDAQSAAPPTLQLLQVPDNGIMVDYVDGAEMAEIFDANWDGAALATPKTFVVGYHPAPGFSPIEGQRVRDACLKAEGHLASRDDGPVVYATLSEVAAAFPR